MFEEMLMNADNNPDELRNLLAQREMFLSQIGEIKTLID